MNDLRKTKQAEENLLYLTFSMPLLLLITYILVIISFVVMFIAGISHLVEIAKLEEKYDVSLPSNPTLLIVGLFGIILTIVVAVLHNKYLDEKFVVVTNKRIRGESSLLGLAKKEFSYRLDMFDDVTYSTVLGVNRLHFVFRQGHLMETKPRTLKFRFVFNAAKIYTSLNILLTDVNNDQDSFLSALALETAPTATDSPANATKEPKENAQNTQEKKSPAKTAKTSTETAVVEDETTVVLKKKLKELNFLLENGIITKEEYLHRKEALFE